MSYVFHESRVVVIETSRRVVRAVLGLGELLHTPSVELLARVGLRRSFLNSVNGSTPLLNSQQSHPHPPTTVRISDYLVGGVLDEALAAGEDVVVYWPFLNGCEVSSWPQAEAVWKYVLFERLGIRRALNECPVLLSMPSGLSRMSQLLICRMFFERFNVPGFTFIDRPLASLYAANLTSGCVIDIGHDETDVVTTHESIIHHGSAFTIPVGIRDCERYLAHILRSNTSVMAALGNATHGQQHPKMIEKNLWGIARQLWKEGHIKVPAEGEPEPEEEGTLDIAALLVSGRERALIENITAKRTNKNLSKADKEREKEIQAMDLVTIQYSIFGSITIGKERHRFCEPLFDPGLLNAINAGLFGRDVQKALDEDGLPEKVENLKGNEEGEMVMPLHAAVHSTIMTRPAWERPHLYLGLLITGDLAKIHGLGFALQSRVAPYLTRDLNPGDEILVPSQPCRAKVAKIPEYFAEFRDKWDILAPFLGSEIIAKLSFGDSSGRNYVSKAAYIEKGPPAMLELAPTLL